MEDDSSIGQQDGSSIFDAKVTELHKPSSAEARCLWNKNLIVIASKRNHPLIYNISDASEEEINANAITLTTEHSTWNLTTIGWKNDGTLLATGDEMGNVRIWNRNGELMFKNRKRVSEIRDLKWNNDGKYILTGDADRTIIVWDSATGECIKHFDHCGPVQAVEWRTNTSFASCGSNEIYVRELGAKNPIKKYQGHKRLVVAIKWCPQGNFLASASDDLTIKITTLNQRNCIQNFEGHLKRINMIKWSPTGPGTANPNMKLILASASDDKTVRLWDVDQGGCLHILKHTESVRSLDFCPDGKLLASGGDDKCLKIWDSESGNLVCKYMFIGEIRDISWNSTGSKLAVCGRSVKAHVLHMKSLPTMDGDPVRDEVATDTTTD